MKYVLQLLFIIGIFLFAPPLAFAQSNETINQFTAHSLTIFISLASLSAVFFLIRGGFLYITSAGKPEELAEAKKTIRNAMIGLIIIIGAGFFVSLLQHAFITPHSGNSTEAFKLTPIQPVEPSNGLTKVLIDAVIGFIQTIIESATKPLVDGLISLLTVTPSLTDNSVIFNYWLAMVGIVDSLFVLLVAVLGFQLMSASTFGFDEIELKHLLPRISFGFLLANISLFVIEWIIELSNMLINATLSATGGITHAWVLNAFDPTVIGANGAGTAVITLLFMLLFIALAIVLMLFYISRLITIAVGAVLSPFIVLLWLLPGFSDFAVIATRSYFIMIFTVFVHIVIIQLAMAFLAVPGQSGINSTVSILAGIATLATLIKAPGILLQFAFYSASGAALKKIGGNIVNVMSSQQIIQKQPKVSTQSHNITKRRYESL